MSFSCAGTYSSRFNFSCKFSYWLCTQFHLGKGRSSCCRRLGICARLWDEVPRKGTQNGHGSSTKMASQTCEWQAWRTCYFQNHEERCELTWSFQIYSWSRASYRNRNCWQTSLCLKSLYEEQRRELPSGTVFAKSLSMWVHEHYDKILKAVKIGLKSLKKSMYNYITVFF